MLAIIDQFGMQSAETVAGGAFWAGLVASLSLYGVVRLPIVVAYVAGAGRSRKHSVVLCVLLVLGFIASTMFLGSAAVPTGDGVRRVLHVNGVVFQVLGLALFVVGILISGLISPQLFPEKWRRTVERLGGAGLPGAFLLGGALGLLQTWAGPHGGAGLLGLMEAMTTGQASQNGLVLLVSFAAGQSLAVLAVGLLTALGKPDLFMRLRTWMCSLEQRIQLLAGNLLMVLGIYLVIIG